VDQVTPRLVGQIIAKAKEAGRSNAVIDGVRHPIRVAYERLIADEVLPASFANPGTDLSEWIGKKRQKKQKRDVDWFAPEVGIPLLKRSTSCRAVSRGAIGLKANTGART
jgi:hypothetical protein